MVRDKIFFSKIKTLNRLQNSVNGNPRYQVIMELPTGEEWVAKTATDSQIGYRIDNREYRNVPVWVTFNGHGSIIDVEVR